MNIGILTFYRAANFGANLQALSTYCFLTKLNHNVIFINYASKRSINEINNFKGQSQAEEHLKFVDSLLPQTPYCSEPNEINAMIEKHHIDALIVGSDAVAQHHPLLSRIKAGRRKPFYIAHAAPERMFPNCFWGVGVNPSVPKVFMSVSCQNSQYQLFSKKLRKKMAEALTGFRYLSVRDEWTKDMLISINPRLEVYVTPDPVFAFNQNVGEMIPSFEDILKKFELPKKYVLVSLSIQSLSEGLLAALKERFQSYGIACVALPMPTGMRFNHSFNHEIPTPLSPMDWYALIKYSSGYIGTNMHPVVVSLHNAVPCFSIDHWGLTDFWGRRRNDGSSKVAHILSVFGVEGNRKPIEKNKCIVSADEIVNGILQFPKELVATKAEEYYKSYEIMMKRILEVLEKN